MHVCFCLSLHFLSAANMSSQYRLLVAGICRRAGKPPLGRLGLNISSVDGGRCDYAMVLLLGNYPCLPLLLLLLLLLRHTQLLCGSFCNERATAPYRYQARFQESPDFPTKKTRNTQIRIIKFKPAILAIVCANTGVSARFSVTCHPRK